MRGIRAVTLATLAFAAICAVFVTTTSARQQVLQNGSYEVLSGDPNHPTVPLNWNSFGDAGQSNAFAFDHTHSALASVRVNSFVGLYQDTVTVTENTHILMKAMAYQPSAAPTSGTIVAGIKLEFFPPGGLNIPPPEENLAFDQNAPLDMWVPVSLTTVVPPQINLANIVIISFDQSSANGFVYADAASAIVSSAPSVNQLLNPSFEEGSSGANGMNPPWAEFADPFSGARKNCFNPPALDGVCTLRAGGMTTGVSQQIVVTPGDTITVSCSFKSLSTGPYNDPNARAGVKIEWVAGSVPSPAIDVAPNANPISGTTNIITPSSPHDQWVPVTIDYTIPQHDATQLRATAINAFGPGVCDVYFDAFEMVLTNVFNGSDADGDNDEDMLDIAQLQRTFTGSGGGLRYGGLVFDQDDDGDVDSSDSDFVLSHMTGPAIVP